MADLLGEGRTSVKVSGSTKEEWLLVISQLYPIVPRPELSLQQLQQVLPVVHKHNFPELLQFVETRLVTQLSNSWSLDPAAPGYIIKWLVMAEQLQLDALKQAALKGLEKQPAQGIRTQMATKVLDADLLHLSLELMLEAWKVSGSTEEEWLLVISQLYPIVPHPELGLQQLQQMLPVVHKYNFSELLQYMSSRLVTQLPSNWSLDPSAPGYIIKWLVTAEQLQLDALKHAALEGLEKQSGEQIGTQMVANELDADLLRLSPRLMLDVA
ncbi:BTB domain-containing protein, partial [Haematococcus lacustris]